MQKNIHPPYKELTLLLANGKKFVTKSSYSKGDSFTLDVDFQSHTAWSGNKLEANKKANKVVRFNDNFGGIDFFSLTESK